MTAAAAPALAPTVRLVAAIGALLLTLAILLGGRVPEAVQMMSRFSDKLMHAAAYGLLAGFWCIAFGGRHRAGAVAAAVCTGLLDEWLQRSLPGRQADVMDLVADALGASAGAWLALPVTLRLLQVPAWMRAAAVYFSLVFGAGFLFGVVRVPLVEPLVGASPAQWLEMPLMALVIVFVARWMVARDRSGLGGGGWLGAGLLAATGILLADLLVGVLLRGMTVWQVVAGRDAVTAIAYHGLVAACAIGPWVAAAACRGRAQAAGRRRSMHG